MNREKPAEMRQPRPLAWLEALFREDVHGYYFGCNDFDFAVEEPFPPLFYA